MTVGEDFVTGQLRGPGGAVFTIGMPLWGATNQICVYYNLDRYAEGRDHEDSCPRPISEWMDQLKTLKDAGFIPFNPGAGARNHFIRLYIQNLSEDVLYKQIDHAIDGNDIGQPDGIVSLKEGAWGTKKKLFSPRSHQAFEEGLKAIKQQVPVLAGGLARARGHGRRRSVDSEEGGSQDWNHGPWRVDVLRADPNVDFEWGTFALPPITTGDQPAGHGRAGARTGRQLGHEPPLWTCPS